LDPWLCYKLHEIIDKLNSLQVQALERELRATLFERRGPKLELTPEGEVLFELAWPLIEGFSGLAAEGCV
jgi:DNA-binding transcriptional LysR family regulator